LGEPIRVNIDFETGGVDQIIEWLTVVRCSAGQPQRSIEPHAGPRVHGSLRVDVLGARNLRRRTKHSHTLAAN
jgi:hypothetical protein